MKRAGWIHRFEHRSETDAGIGMLGERLMWQQMSWDYVREATALDLGERGPVPEGVLESIAAYQELLREQGIDPGPLGTHLVSIILFIRRDLLERIGGFPLFGDSYLEAVAGEIGLSKRIEDQWPAHFAGVRRGLLVHRPQPVERWRKRMAATARTGEDAWRGD